MQPFSHAISRTRFNILSWKKSGLCHIDIELNNIQLEISKLEDPAGLARDSWHSIWLRALHNRYNALSKQQSIFWGQHAKLLWMNKVDLNSRYFHNSVKIRHHKNLVRSIQDTYGNTFIDQAGIENSFSNFFKNLWSSSSSHNLDFFLHAIPDDLPTLTDLDRESLTRPVTKYEVYKTLKSMSCGKSPGPDGLNVEFYIFYWNLIGDQFYNAISYFFFHWPPP